MHVGDLQAEIDKIGKIVGTPVDPNAPQVSSTIKPTGGGLDFLREVPDLIFRAFQTKQAIKIAKLNQQRMAQGLSPLTDAQIQQMGPGVSVGLSEETKRLLVWGGVGLAGLLVITAVTRRR